MSDVIIHDGTQGQKWGTRRYRNYDGTLTEEGRRRYNYYEKKTDRSYETGRAKQAGPKTYLTASSDWAFHLTSHKATTKA